MSKQFANDDVRAAERALRIVDPAAARVFSDPRRRRLVLELAKGPRSVKELASATAMSLSLLGYHIARLEEFGLVRVAEEIPRAGRALKLYVSVATSFFIPSHLATEHPYGPLRKELHAALEQADAKRKSRGTLYFIDERNRVRISVLAGEEGAASAECWRLMRLTQKEASQLVQQMQALLTHFGELRSPGAKERIVLFAIAPRLR